MGTAEIHFFREGNTLFVWTWAFSSIKLVFLLSLSAGFTCSHLSVGSFLHMNYNGIIDMVIFLGRFAVGLQVRQKPKVAITWATNNNFNVLEFLCFMFQEEHLFIYHSVCHLPTSDDRVSCSVQMNFKNKSLALQTDIFALWNPQYLKSKNLLEQKTVWTLTWHCLHLIVSQSL